MVNYSPQTESLLREAQVPKSVSSASAQNGTSLDTAKKYARALFIFTVDNAGGSQVTCAVHESDDDTTYTLITNKSVVHAAANDGKVASVEVNLDADGVLSGHGGAVGRYIRTVMTPSTASATLIGAVALLYPKGGARPVTQQVAALHVDAEN